MQRMTMTMRKFHTTRKVLTLALNLSHDRYFPKHDGVLPANKSPNPLLILHGLFGSKQNWRSLGRALAQRLGTEVIPVDLRNHGESPHSMDHSFESMAMDLDKLCDHMGWDHVDVLGHSMGGKAAMHFGLSRPARAKRLVVVDMAPYIQNLGSEFASYIVGMREIISSNVASAKQADQILTKTVPELAVRQFLLTNLKESDNGLRFRINLDALELALKNNTISGFPLLESNKALQYNQPALFIRGTQAKYVQDKHIPAIKAIFPNSEVVDVDAGHWLHSEKPDEFLKIVTSFLLEDGQNLSQNKNK